MKTEKKYVYAEHTYNSKNMLQRFAHRMRFKKSLNLMPSGREIRLLDYGCGDGFFLNILNINKINGGGGIYRL